MEEQPDWMVQAAVNIIGATALVGVGTLSAWYRRKGMPLRGDRPAQPTPQVGTI